MVKIRGERVSSIRVLHDHHLFRGNPDHLDEGVALILGELG